MTSNKNGYFTHKECCKTNTNTSFFDNNITQYCTICNDDIYQIGTKVCQCGCNSFKIYIVGTNFVLDCVNCGDFMIAKRMTSV